MRLRFIQENPNAEVLHPSKGGGPPSSISCSSGKELELRRLMKLETMSGSNGDVRGNRRADGQKQNKNKVIYYVMVLLAGSRGAN